MGNRLTTSLVALGITTVFALTGCASPVIVPADDTSVTDPGGSNTTDPGSANPTIESMVDPSWPWPADIPRPDGIFYEFTTKNPLGEGGMWQITFNAPDYDAAKAYVDQVLGAGWETILGSDAVVSDNEAVWSITRDSAFGAIAVKDITAKPVEVDFSFMGSLD